MTTPYLIMNAVLEDIEVHLLQTRRDLLEETAELINRQWPKSMEHRYLSGSGLFFFGRGVGGIGLWSFHTSQAHALDGTLPTALKGQFSLFILSL